MNKVGLNENDKSFEKKNDKDDGLGGNIELLSTIVLPTNLKLLTERLPKSKYEEPKMTKS